MIDLKRGTLGSAPKVFLLALACLANPAGANDQSVELIGAQPSQGFHFPYFLFIPEVFSADGVVLIVESNNTGVKDDFSQQIKATRESMAGFGIGPLIARQLNQPLLMPVFPRTERDWKTYTHALDRDTLLIRDSQLNRLDQQLLAMVENAKSKLSNRNISVHDKFILCGFSASGTFSNRFAFLHPSSLAGVISGAVNGIPMLPIAALSDEVLDYPIGISDLQQLTGKAFDQSSWLKLPQLIFMGAQDKNDTTQFQDAFSDRERSQVHRLLGKRMIVDRWTTAQSIYLESEANATLVTYGGLGHGTNGRVHRDLLNFAGSIISNLSK